MPRSWIPVNLGTPAAPTPEAVRAFLAEFLGDPMVVDFPGWLWKPILHGIILRTRPAKTAEAYEAIWTPDGSPLASGTRRLCQALAELAPEDVAVRGAYRYGGEERVDRVLERALESSDSVTVATLFPQPTASSSETIEVLVRETAARLGASERVRLAALAPDDAGYVAATAELIEVAEERLEGGRADAVVLSFHGIPVRVDRRESGRYSQACAQTAAAIRARLGRSEDEVILAFQSKFGPGAWLPPATTDVLDDLARAGKHRVVVATPGFLTPGLETLEELGLRAREDFLAAGGQELRLADPPTAHPLFLRSLAAVFDSQAS